jgi:hypothetical protein
MKAFARMKRAARRTREAFAKLQDSLAFAALGTALRNAFPHAPPRDELHRLADLIAPSPPAEGIVVDVNKETGIVTVDFSLPIPAETRIEATFTLDPEPEPAPSSHMADAALYAMRAVKRCAGCGEHWPCSDSKRTDILPEMRARHYVAQQHMPPRELCSYCNMLGGRDRCAFCCAFLSDLGERVPAMPACTYCRNEATAEDLCPTHAQHWARTRGLIAALSLPDRRGDDGVFRRPRIVVADAGEWHEVTAAWFDSKSVTVMYSTGSIVRPLSLGAPMWREEVQS